MAKSCLVDNRRTAFIHLIDSFLLFYLFHSLSLSLSLSLSQSLSLDLVSPISTVHCFQRFFFPVHYLYNFVLATLFLALVQPSYIFLLFDKPHVNSDLFFLLFLLRMAWVIRAETSRFLKIKNDSGQKEIVCLTTHPSYEHVFLTSSVRPPFHSFFGPPPPPCIPHGSLDHMNYPSCTFPWSPFFIPVHLAHA